MIEVKMWLTDEDVERAEKIMMRHDFMNKAQVVSESLSLVNHLGKAAVSEGAKVVLEFPDGRRERVIKPELGLV